MPWDISPLSGILGNCSMHCSRLPVPDAIYLPRPWGRTLRGISTFEAHGCASVVKKMDVQEFNLSAMLTTPTHHVINVMGDYKKILLALDFSEYTEILCQRAAMLSKVFNATVNYIHVVEPVLLDMPYDVLPAESIELEQDLVRHAHERLAELAKQHGLKEEQIQVEMGSSKAEILRVAEEQEIDLILIGSHGRHGIALLLGSTANAVLHGAPCDVLAIRIK